MRRNRGEGGPGITWRRHAWLGVAACLVATFMLAVTSMARKSVTIDEYVYPTGLAILRTGSFHIDHQTAPLPKMLAAIPLLFSEATFDLSDVDTYHTGWACGNRFARQNEARYPHLFFGGRVVSVLMLLLTCLLTAGYARSLYGRKAMLLAAALVCFDPNLIAHGRLIMPDIYLAGALVATLWAFDRFLRRPCGLRALWLGACLGLATLSKFTGVLLFVLLPLLAFGFRLASRRCAPEARGAVPALDHGKAWLWMAAALACGIFVINAGYAFDGTLTSLGAYTFSTAPFQALQQLLPASLPVPLPVHFLAGMDTQLGESGYQTYLLGELRRGGFRHFYAVALLAKLPLVTLALGTVAFICRPRISWRELVYLVPAGGLFVFFSLAGHKNGGLRYVLFLLPLLAIWSSRLLSAAPGRRNPPRRWIPAVCIAAPVLLVLTTLRAWPDYLPFFNSLAGGPRNGHNWLLDSDLDFGQDLVALANYMKANRLPGIDLAYYGRVRPELYGISYTHFFQGNRHRYAAISASLLWGKPYFVNGTAWWMPDKDLFASFRDRTPVAVLGHTIYLFDLADAENRTALAELNARRARLLAR